MDLTKHGNPTEAWSVGKYAKRSATIHLCSNDLTQTAGHFRHKTTIIDRFADGLVIWDPDDDVADGITDQSNVPNARVTIHHPDGVVDDTVFDDVELVAPQATRVRTTKLKITTLSHKDLLTGPSMIPGLDPTVADTDEDRNNILRGDHTNVLGGEIQNRKPYHKLVQRQQTADNHCAMILNKNNPMVSSVYQSPDNYIMVIPVHMFPEHTEEGTDGRILHERLAMDYDRSPNSWIKRARSDYRLELYHSENANAAVTTNNDGAGDTTDGPLGSASQWDYEYSTKFDVVGIYGNPALPEHFVVVRLPDDIYFSDLFDVDDNGDFDLNRGQTYDATDANSEFSLARTFGNNPHFSLDHQWRFNVRKMPTAFFEAYNQLPEGQDHCNYEVTIPNTIGYPEHKRCLVQVQSLCLYAKNEFLDANIYSTEDRVNPVYVGVILDGVAGQNVYSTYLSNEVTDSKVSTTSLVGTCCLDVRGRRTTLDSGHTRGTPLSYGFDNHRSILDDGVLISSPFGKQLRVRLINLTNKKSLNTNASPSPAGLGGAGHHLSNDIIENPTHLTLRILFLDDDDLPDR
eukprot:COSAG04_NODE_533_length_12959_cov_8.218497_6_plen_572_part_00